MELRKQSEQREFQDLPSTKQSHTDLRLDNWTSERSKFPEYLREPLKLVCQATFKYDIFGTREKALFEALPSIFPYNQFTLTVCPRSF